MLEDFSFRGFDHISNDSQTQTDQIGPMLRRMGNKIVWQGSLLDLSVLLDIGFEDVGLPHKMMILVCGQMDLKKIIKHLGIVWSM